MIGIGTLIASLRTFAILMTVAALVAVSGAEASMDIPCLSITKAEADAILLKEAKIKAMGKIGYVTEDGYSLQAAGLDQYCTIVTDGLRELFISGNEHGYYGIAVFTQRDEAAANEFLTRLNESMEQMAYSSQHTSRLGPASILNIIRVGQ